MNTNIYDENINQSKLVLAGNVLDLISNNSIAAQAAKKRAKK